MSRFDIVKRENVLLAANNEQKLVGCRLIRGFYSSPACSCVFLTASSPFDRPFYEHPESAQLASFKFNSLDLATRGDTAPLGQLSFGFVFRRCNRAHAARFMQTPFVKLFPVPMEMFREGGSEIPRRFMRVPGCLILCHH